jgi:hypothetical protein
MVTKVPEEPTDASCLTVLWADYRDYFVSVLQTVIDIDSVRLDVEPQIILSKSGCLDVVFGLDFVWRKPSLALLHWNYVALTHTQAGMASPAPLRIVSTACSQFAIRGACLLLVSPSRPIGRR